MVTCPEKPPLFRIVCFNGRGQACADYLTKGRRVFVQGCQRTRTYNDRDGEERRATVVNTKTEARCRLAI